MAFGNRFPWAYLLFALCLVWSEGLWLTSDTLLELKKKSQKFPAKRKRLSDEETTAIMRHKRRQYRFKKWGWCAGIAVIGIACIAVVAQWNYQWELQQTFGLLTPADDPLPPSPCNNMPISPDDVRLYGGDSMAAFPPNKSSFLISVGGYKPLWMTSTPKGDISISGDIYGADGDIAHIEDNHFQLSSRLAFKPLRPDRHTLVVMDDWHRTVLRIRFLNRHAVQFTGIFFIPGHSPLIVEDHSITYGGMHISGGCSADALNGAISF